MPFNSPREKADPLRYTVNYVYNVADCIGKGATASVYLGRHQRTGLQVAIKVFSFPETPHITRSRERETAVLKAVSHRNVMSLLAFEIETSGPNDLIMPYCQGGSVYTLLEMPENGFGFEEKEFLRFLCDITTGLQYLKENNIIHRDIKPGNILKRVEEDGSSVYILTDFGAAREMNTEEETFESIYGTEEYIHPDMFQRAVLRQPGQNKFDSSVDLWSLAVTIYHVATGKLPFQSYGGRNDSRTTFEIISGRQSGDLSGVQRQPGGPIDRSKHLPDICYLSKGLRELVEHVLAGLFEKDTRHVMSFEHYFEEVTTIVNMKTLKVFFPQNCIEFILYMKKTDSLIHIQEKIASLTDIPADRQILLLGQTELRHIVERHEQIQTFPKAVQNAQLFLFERDEFDEHRLPVPHKLPQFPPLAQAVTLSSDASIGRKRTAVAFYIEWKLSEAKRFQMLLLESRIQLRLFVQNKVHLMERVLPEMEKEIELTRNRANFIRQSKLVIQASGRLFLNDTSKGNDVKAVIRQFCFNDDHVEDMLQKAEFRCREINVYLSVLVQRIRECSTTTTTDHLGCNEEDNCLKKVEHLRQSIQNVSTTFTKHKKYGELHPHETFIHNTERQNLEDICAKILSLFQGHCLSNLETTRLSVNKQNSNVLKHLTRVGKVESNIQCVLESQNQINEILNKVEGRFNTVSTLLQSYVETLPTNGMSKDTGIETSDPTKALEEMSVSSTDRKSALLKQLKQEVSQIELDRTEFDGIISSNTKSLMELKRTLESSSNTNPSTHPDERRSLE